jgi:hypothetical protein
MEGGDQEKLGEGDNERVWHGTSGMGRHGEITKHAIGGSLEEGEDDGDIGAPWIEISTQASTQVRPLAVKVKTYSC